MTRLNATTLSAELSPGRRVLVERREGEIVLTEQRLADGVYDDMERWTLPLSAVAELGAALAAHYDELREEEFERLRRLHEEDE